MNSRKRKSRRRSPTLEPPSEVFFTDCNLECPTFSEPILAAGFLLKRFPFRQDTPDKKWIEYCAKQGWIGLTQDRKITAKPDELAAVMKSGAALFVLKAGKRTNHAILAESFLRNAASIVRFFRKHQPPYVASVTRPNARDWDLGLAGRVTMLRSYESWLANRHKRRR